MASVEDNKRFIRRFMTAIGGDLEAMDAGLAADARWIIPRSPGHWGPSVSGSYDKAAFSSSWYADHAGVFPEGRTITIVNMTAEEDRVAVECEATAR